MATTIRTMESFKVMFDEALEACAGLKGYSITQQIVNKNGREFHGYIVRVPEERIAPVFYLEDFFDKHSRGESVDECVDSIVSFMRKFKTNKPSNVTDKFLNWESAKSHVEFFLVPSKKEDLSNTPYESFYDMSIIAKIYIENEPGIGTGAIKVDNALMEIWGIDKQTLFDAARQNTERCGVHTFQLSSMFCEEEMDGAPEVLVIALGGSRRDAYGATVLCCDMLKDFVKNSGKSWYVMPVSIHEVLLIEHEVPLDCVIGMFNGIITDKSLSEDSLSNQLFVLDSDGRLLPSKVVNCAG